MKFKTFIFNIRKYVITEILLYGLIIFFTVGNISIFYDINLYPALWLILFSGFFLYKKKKYYSLKNLTKILDSILPKDVSVINALSFDHREEKYNFSPELLNKERERNLKLLDERVFLIKYKNLVILSIITFIIGFSYFCNYFFIQKIIQSPFLYAVSPGNIEVFYNTEIEFSINHNRITNTHIVFVKNDKEEKYLMENSVFNFTISENLIYYFESGNEKTEHYEIKTVYPLNIESVETITHYPEYLEIPALQGNRESFSAVSGSRIWLKFNFNNKISDFEFISEAENFLYTDNKNEIIINNFNSDIVYKIRATDSYSEFISPDFIINLKKDERPHVNFVIPESEFVVSETAEFNVKFIAKDDFKILKTVLEIEFDNEQKEEILIDNHNSAEFVRDFAFTAQSGGRFRIAAYDSIGPGYSKFIRFEIINEMKALIEIMDVTQNEVEKIENISKDFSEIIELNREQIEQLFSKSEITPEDRKFLSNLSEQLENLMEKGKDIEKNLKGIEKFKENQDISSQIYQKIDEIRKALDDLLDNHIKSFIQDISELSSKQNMDFNDYKKFSDRMNLEKMQKQLEDTLNLLKKAQKENEQKALIDYLEMIINSQRQHITHCVSNINNTDFGALKGIQISARSIHSTFKDVEDFLKIPVETVEKINFLFKKSIEEIFINLEKSIKTQHELIILLTEVTDEMKNELEKSKEKDKKKIMNLLENLYSSILDMLKRTNEIEKFSKTGKSASFQAPYIMEVRKILEKAVQIYEEINRNSFILESLYLARLVENHSHLVQLYERGKENRNVYSYIHFTGRNLMETGIHIVDAVEKMEGMDSSTALSEFLERLEKLSKMQQGLSQEMLDMMGFDNSLESFMDYYSYMQEMLRREMEKLGNSMMSEELNQAAKEMVEIEKKLQEKNLDEDFLKKKQENIRENINKVVITLTDKLDKNEYKSETASKKENEEKGFTINKSVEKGFSDFRMPDSFPETGVVLEQMIKDYLNSL